MSSKLKRRRFEGCTLKQADGCFNVPISILFFLVNWAKFSFLSDWKSGSEELLMTELLALPSTDDSGYGKPFSTTADPPILCACSVSGKLSQKP